LGNLGRVLFWRLRSNRGAGRLVARAGPVVPNESDGLRLSFGPGGATGCRYSDAQLQF